MKYQLLILLTLGLWLGTTGGRANATDISGTWKGAIDRPGNSYGPLDITVVFKQQGEKLTGTYSDGIKKGEQREISGTVTGNKVVFSWELKPPTDINKPGLIVTFAGTLESPTKLTGSIRNPFCEAECKWTVIKQKK